MNVRPARSQAATIPATIRKRAKAILNLLDRSSRNESAAFTAGFFLADDFMA